MQIKKNDVYTIEITDTGTQGEGIGRADGCALFVKDALIGDVVQVKIMKVKKTYAYGEAGEGTFTFSFSRCAPLCVQPAVRGMSAPSPFL